MQRGIVLFMGIVRRGEYESLLDRGIPLGILIDSNNQKRLGDVSPFTFVETFDFSRPVADLIAAVSEIRDRLGLACLFNVNELYVSHTAHVATALAIPGISPASARLCLDKNPMRQRFQERIGSDASARFHNVIGESDLIEAAERFGYPAFLQPTNVSASMWATRNTDRETLLKNYRAILAEVPKQFAAVGQKEKAVTVVVAEYLQGANTSIDCLSDRNGHVYTTPLVDVLTGYDIGIDDFHHFARIVPSQVREGTQIALGQLAIAGVQALDITNCASHVEFIGSKLGEIAGRPGGNRPRILELAFGIDFLHAYYQVLCGRVPDLNKIRERAAAVVTPYPRKNGILRNIRYLDRLTELRGYHYHEVRAKIGQAVGLAKSGYRAPLYVEFVSADVQDVIGSALEIASWTDLYEVE